MNDKNQVFDMVTPGARQLLETAAHLKDKYRHAQAGAHHWLLALVERHGPMAEAMTRGFDATAVQRDLYGKLERGETGAELSPQTLIEKACLNAKGRGRVTAGERDIAAVILAAAGYEVAEQSHAHAGGPDAPASGSSGASYQPCCARPTPMLDKFGRDVTREAARGKLVRLVGREEELALIVETLCRSVKRNPILVGPAGVGKTAIVEGLAQRVVAGDVPDLLRGIRLIEVNATSLLAGASMQGETEKRIKSLLSEARSEGIVLFVDEVHMMIGAGGREGTSDLASHFKPALARGDLACVAATTDDEYRRIFEPDAALARRFQPVRVHEPTVAQTASLLRVRRDELREKRNVHVDDSVIDWLVGFADQYLHNRRFPDKAVDLLEQAVAHAVTRGSREVANDDAVTVAQRLAGMPLAIGDRLARLRDGLRERTMLSSGEAEVIVNRLEVTLRGLDMSPHRANAVVLLSGPAAERAATLATTIADTIYGSPARVVTIDFSVLTRDHDVSGLIGAAPSYVGYNAHLPIHDIAQAPWCVVLCQAVDACHPVVRSVLAQALRNGFFTDGTGRRIYLSDAVVLLTAVLDGSAGADRPSAAGARGPFGFVGTQPASQPKQDSSDAVVLERTLGSGLMDLVDVVVAGSQPESGTGDETEVVLRNLADRLRRRGVEPKWDESLCEWLSAQAREGVGAPGLQQLVDNELLPAIAPHASDGPCASTRVVQVCFRDGLIKVTEVTKEDRDGA